MVALQDGCAAELLRAVPSKQVQRCPLPASQVIFLQWLTPAFATNNSVGTALTDTLDDLIQDHRIDPQLAMKILANFDRAIAEVLQEKVRSRLTFKVMMTRNHKSSSAAFHPKDPRAHPPFYQTSAYQGSSCRVVSTRIDSATKFGPSSSRT